MEPLLHIVLSIVGNTLSKYAIDGIEFLKKNDFAGLWFLKKIEIDITYPYIKKTEELVIIY